MISARVEGGRVWCGRPGCPKDLGEIVADGAIRLRGSWYRAKHLSPVRWRFDRGRGESQREGGRFIAHEWFPSGEIEIGAGKQPATVECPRCRAVQTITAQG